MKIDGEKAYPIYYISVKWSEDGEWKKDDPHPKWHKGLRKGRIWNSTGFYKMFKEEQSDEALKKYAKDWWKNYTKKKKEIGSKELLSTKNPRLKNLKFESRGHEVWLLTWFEHETFDIGQTDIEALDSFEKFVQRKQEHNRQFTSEMDKGHYCLMGAEDRYRWHGSGPDGERDEEASAPCRCKHCKKAGLIRIAH